MLMLQIHSGLIGPIVDSGHVTGRQFAVVASRRIRAIMRHNMVFSELPRSGSWKKSLDIGVIWRQLQCLPAQLFVRWWHCLYPLWASTMKKAGAAVIQDDDDDVDLDAIKGKKAGAASTRRRTEATALGMKDFSSSLVMKPDQVSRPVWVCPDGHIFLETFSPIYKQAYDFLISIAEPVSRPPLIHEYELNSESLMSAASSGLTPQVIVTTLERISKNQVPQTVKVLIVEWTSRHAKARLVLQQNRFFIETTDEDVMMALLRDETIRTARVHHDPSAPEAAGLLPVMRPARSSVPTWERGDAANVALLNAIDRDDEDDGPPGEEAAAGHRQSHSFEIANSAVELTLTSPFAPHKHRSRCQDLHYPAMEEYDFRNDPTNPPFPIELQGRATIRPYQEKALSRMFGSGSDELFSRWRKGISASIQASTPRQARQRALSGVIVLPCGAGKTLVGITAACTIKKSTLVLCTNAISVEQWKYQFKYWSTVTNNQVACFTADKREQLPTSGLVVTTYNMLTFGGRRNAEGKKILDAISQREWGLLLLDEIPSLALYPDALISHHWLFIQVPSFISHHRLFIQVHVVPANVFRRVFEHVHAHCKLGLTATLVREDNLIGDLNYLIGPKLYEANWLDLQIQGFLARVQCIEVWCPMTPAFFKEYLGATSAKRTLLYTMNPTKFNNTEYLIRFHEARGDKVLVFSDNLFALERYATQLGKYYMCGTTNEVEREKLLEKFKNDPDFNCLFISKVGDNSIDLPSANVIIQISSHFGSRRQEAQRLGRILRPKSTGGSFNAFFYSLVSKDTQEMYYATKRQRFLVDQGYTFKAADEQLHDKDDISQLAASATPGPVKRTKGRRQWRPRQCGDSVGGDMIPKGGLLSALFVFSQPHHRTSAHGAHTSYARAASLSAISGGANLLYREVRQAAKAHASKPRSALFRQHERDVKKVQAEFKKGR
ncbi:putative General transcription and DNA repair factor IIH helicase subunit XPB [Paratrimastix pyriformis]|uniref:DNA 3'-5' helicase n=1 Tax=Paratrimastix pyriformis TaxID=342808 RepID=A0ABQ8UBD3_9EUKA|nr:putative General transcription and DNA repair factor IIH helicase subunit XPB [Paratrimastix pyriformis]